MPHFEVTLVETFKMVIEADTSEQAKELANALNSILGSDAWAYESTVITNAVPTDKPVDYSKAEAEENIMEFESEG